MANKELLSRTLEPRNLVGKAQTYGFPPVCVGNGEAAWVRFSAVPRAMGLGKAEALDASERAAQGLASYRGLVFMEREEWSC